MASIYKSQAGTEAVEERYRRVLQRWPVPSRQVMVPTCQGDTFVIVSGEDHARYPNAAPPVVLLHGSGTNSSIWMRDVAEWAQHHRVYAVDMIGNLASAPRRGHPSGPMRTLPGWMMSGTNSDSRGPALSASR